ncbi:hypothetical protein KKB71_01385 [Patescibacteria group bacterium]|nr:hypothetical protein [Patescibacteria group bacterium]
MFEGPSFEKIIEPEPEKKDEEKVQEKPLEKTSEKTQSEQQEKLKAESDQKDAEMKQKDAEVRPEIEAKFRDALGTLHTKIQSIQEAGNDFPSKDKLRTLIEGVSVFAQMQEGAKKIFVDALDRKKEFCSPDPMVFIEKGMEVLGIIIHAEVIKKGGDLWLQERMEKRSAEIQPEMVPEENKEKEIPKET